MKGNYKQAVEVLKTAEEGEIAGALWHEYSQNSPNKGWGLKKILEKHPEVAENLDEIIKNLPISAENARRITLDNGTHNSF
jgi:hypothetical protein